MLGDYDNPGLLFAIVHHKEKVLQIVRRVGELDDRAAIHLLMVGWRRQLEEATEHLRLDCEKASEDAKRDPAACDNDEVPRGKPDVFVSCRPWFSECIGGCDGLGAAVYSRHYI